MHTLPPEKLSETVTWILSYLEKNKPAFIVDTHKKEFPWDRPPLELWPTNDKGQFLPPDEKILTEYDRQYSKLIADNIDRDEAARFNAMQPFRRFIMQNYKLEKIFGQHVLFKFKN